MSQVIKGNQKGRPRVKINFDTLYKLTNDGYGCKRIARIMTENGEYVSASTINRLLKSIDLKASPAPLKLIDIYC